jgi:hypothetical protein
MATAVPPMRVFSLCLNSNYLAVISPQWGMKNEGFRGRSRLAAAFSLYYQRKQRMLALAIERHLPATYWSGPK